MSFGPPVHSQPRGAPRAPLRIGSLLFVVAFAGHDLEAQGEEVPVTIKELDVEGAMREFQAFQQELDRHRQEISEGQKTAIETAQILEELRSSASADNDHNEAEILEAVRGYIDGVVARQVALVDFLESQRYRISYYANQMAASVRPEDLVMLFGNESQNVRELTARVQSVDAAQERIAEFVDGLSEEEFDKRTFRPRASMPLAKRRALDALLYRYQHERNSQELAKSRLRLVQEMQRKTAAGAARTPDVNPDLLLGQMFGALDRIRLQMSADLLFLESFLGRYARSVRTHEILLAFQRLVEMQGGLGGPSQGLASVMDWLQTSTFRRLRLDVDGLTGPGVEIPRAADLLREAYLGARPAPANQIQEMSR